MNSAIASRSALLLLLFMLAGCADLNVRRGASAFDRGEYDQAAALWNGPAKAGNPHAQYNLGLLWEGGLGSTPMNAAEASHWYLLSAQQGYTPAMIRLARIQLAQGHQQAAKSWLVLAARWGNGDAGYTLASLGEPIPAADLLAQQQYAEEAQDDALGEALLSVSSDVGRTLGCAMAGGNCGTQPLPPSQHSYQRPGPDSSQPSAAPTYSQKTPAPSVLVDKQCTSDFSCGIGFTCVKAPMMSDGVCMKSVNEYGIQQYNMPSGESIGPNTDPTGQCQFDTQCPVGFRCDTKYKACVRK